MTGKPIRLIELSDLDLFIKVDALGNVYTLDKTNIIDTGLKPKMLRDKNGKFLRKVVM